MSVVVCTFAVGDNADLAAELLTLARRLASDAGTDLRWLVAGPAHPESLQKTGAEYGVSAIDHINSPEVVPVAPDVSVEALAQYCASRPSETLLMSQTFDARLVAPRLAARLNAAVVMNALDLESDGITLRVTTSAYGGDTRAVYEVAATPRIIGVLPNATSPETVEGPAPVVELVDVDLSKVEERIAVVERREEEGPRLEDAQIIVAGGRGLGSADKFALVEELAAALGGMAAASRPIVDEGWAPRAQQIGLTGKIARPALYIAAGISGASQHMAGCAAAKTIVAINRDADAPIFRHARYGIVGDCLEVLSELTKAVR